MYLQSILNWIQCLFTNREACVLMKGTFTERTFMGKGVSQCDITKPYIFIIALEILLIKINYT